MARSMHSCYEKLDSDRREFRLLTIERGNGSSEIQCSLWQASLDGLEIHDWETVSYCWGDPSQRVPLMVDGHTILVPPNAIHAITRLRLPERDRVLWIDSVCINQADLQERSNQVASMGLIYRKAIGNLIFLGDAPDVDARLVAETLQNAAERVRFARPQLNQTEEMGFMTGLAPGHWLINGTVSLEELRVLEPLYQSRWFQRLWVVQEASLARKNTCFLGGANFPLEDALLTASINARPPRFAPEATKGIFAAASMRQFALPSLHPLNLGGEHFLTYHPIIRTMVTTDPRDRVFAILDLYRHRAGLDGLPRLLIPDYTKPVPAVFRDATRHALTEPASGGLLSTICHRTDADMIDNGYTSWTKRFDRSFSPNEDCLALRSAAATFPPDSTVHRLELAESGDPSLLRLRAWIIGRLTWASVIAPTPQFRSLNFESAKALVDSVFARSVTVAAQQTHGMDDAYSLAADVLSTGSLGDHEAQFSDRASKQAAFKLYLEYLYEHGTVPSMPEDGLISENERLVMNFHKLLSNQTHRRRCFQLNSGHVGIGPAIAREGDVLVICNGAEHPYLLRPNGLEHLFVGAAYVPGFMTGQVFHLNLQSNWLSIR